MPQRSITVNAVRSFNQDRENQDLPNPYFYINGTGVTAPYPSNGSLQVKAYGNYNAASDAGWSVTGRVSLMPGTTTFENDTSASFPVTVGIPDDYSATSLVGSVYFAFANATPFYGTYVWDFELIGIPAYVPTDPDPDPLPDAPAAPTGPNGNGAPGAPPAECIGAAIALEWAPVTGSLYFTLYRDGTLLATNLTGLSYTDYTVIIGTVYLYTLSVTTAAGTSVQSEEYRTTPCINLNPGTTPTEPDSPPTAADASCCGSDWKPLSLPLAGVWARVEAPPECDCD